MDIVQALLIAGLPIAVLAFLMTYLSYRNGDIEPEDDQKDEWGLSADWDDIDGMLDDDRPSNNYVHKKWLSFGGGYYGLVALLTLVFIEGRELYNLFLIREQLPELLAAPDRHAVAEIIESQVMNMVDAFIWFQFWPNEIEMRNGWVWLGVSYAGYYSGNRLSKYALKAHRSAK
jgi:hypothetical protein